MVSVTVVERSFRRTHVYFRVTGVVGLYSCSVNNSSGKPFPIEGALLWLMTITFPGSAVTLFFISIYTFIMPLNDGCHVRHAAITNLDRIYVEDFM